MLAVCATPIGNLDDVTLRVLAEFREADVVLCEDTRRTRILLERHGIRARTISYHRHNEAKRTAELLPRLLAGERIALASDAGLPGVGDPGARLVAAALAVGVDVTVLPGASAVETAAVASGLLTGGYRFVGYLPRAEKGRAELWRQVANSADATVAFESPNRLPASLASLASLLPERRVAVCRELTKRFEEIVRGSARELAERFSEAPKGEVTLVVAAGAAGSAAEGPGAAGGEEDAIAVVAELAGSGFPRSRAAELVAGLTGIARNRLYRGSLPSSE